MKNKKNEELQNRREFFKKAAKGALPFLGTITFAPSIIMTTLTSCGDCDGCEATCSDSCDKNCGSACIMTCSTGCESGNEISTGCNSACNNSSTNSACSNCSSQCADLCSNNCTGQASSVPSISDASGSIDGYEYVDLGLSVKWARFNIGATKPEGYGKYFSFADPTGYEVGSSQSSADYYYQELHWSEFYSIYIGDKTICGTNYDTATYQWGNKWRMPTVAEFKELSQNCEVSFETYNGIAGFKFTSKKNSNSIFLPAAGTKLSENSWNLKEVGTTVEYWSGDLAYFGKKNGVGNGTLAQAYAKQLYIYNGSLKDYSDMTEWIDSKLTIRPVTTGSNNGGGNGGGTNTCSGCSAGCSSGCKDSCSGNCANTCRTGCGGCNSTCGGTCTYLSRGSSCSGCATTCSNRCYTSCTLACSDNCQSSCVYGSK